MVGEAEISRHCPAQLVNYKGPTEVRVLQQLPLTAAQKTDRIALRRDDLPALGDDARTALDPVLMVLLSACCLHQRYFQ